MPRCGATFDEDRVPPWIRGDFRGVLGGEYQPTPALRASDGGHFKADSAGGGTGTRCYNPGQSQFP
jgi:hypothetical protein